MKTSEEIIEKYKGYVEVKIINGEQFCHLDDIVSFVKAAKKQPEWIKKEEGKLPDDCLCLVKLKNCARIEMACYQKYSDTFLLDNPESRYALIPLDIDQYLIIPPLEDNG